MRGSSVAELVVACGLFSVFMLISVGMFTGMTRVVRSEQQPAERILEARTTLLKITQRIRNCERFVTPSFRELLDQPTHQLILRDGVLQRAVFLVVENEGLLETQYPIDYDPTRVSDYKPITIKRLMKAREFTLTSGGLENPTRVTIEIVMLDGKKVKSVTNLRESL
jgi:hypothetical protein